MPRVRVTVTTAEPLDSVPVNIGALNRNAGDSGMAAENSEVSPVARLVAVAASTTLAGKTTDSFRSIVRIAGGIGGERRRSQERLALTVAAGVGRLAGEELDQERRCEGRLLNVPTMCVTVPLKLTEVSTG